MRFRFTALSAIAAALLLSGCGNNGGPTVSNSALSATSHSVNAASIGPDTAQSPAEIWNGWVTPPSPSGPQPTDFEIILAGNVTGDIPNPPEPGYGLYDPFCPPSQTCNNISIAYNPSSNTTTVEFSGSTLYQNIPGYAPLVHFGLLNGPGGSHIKCFTRETEWTFASAPPEPVPIVNINPKNCKKQKKGPESKGTMVYATVYLETSFSPITPSQPATSGGWYDVPYTRLSGSEQPEFVFTNGGSQTIYTANSGIVLNESLPGDKTCQKTVDCKGNIAYLERLNFADMPPPGSKGSPFIPMEFPPPSKIPPGSPAR